MLYIYHAKSMEARDERRLYNKGLTGPWAFLKVKKVVIVVGVVNVPDLSKQTKLIK